jgi:hypothetical protein
MELLPELLNEKGMVAVIFTVIAAITSVLTEKREKKNRRSSDRQSSQLIEKAFLQMEKNVEELRKQNEEMREDFKSVYNELIEINNTQSAQLTKLNLELFYRNERLDNP